MIGQPLSDACDEMLDIIRMPRRYEVPINHDRLVVTPDSSVLLNNWFDNEIRKLFGQMKAS
jgi:hypothetical protein